MQHGYLLLILLTAGRCFGQAEDAMRLFLSPEVGVQDITVDYAADHHFEEDTDQAGEDMSFTAHDFNLRLPISQDERHEWTFGTGLSAVDFETDVKFPDPWFRLHRDSFPDELYDVRIDTTYRHRLDNDWILGGQLAISSPSDRPFASLEEMAVMVNAALRIPQGESDAWLFFLNYSSNREFLQHIPIPGIGYQLKREKISALIGAPVTTIHVEPLEWLHLDALYFVPRTIRAEISVPIDPIRIYGGYNWTNERYLRHDRRDEDDRLFYYEQNVKTGIEWKITDSISLDVHGGYAFNRFFFEGEEYDDRGRNRINLDDGPFVGARLVIGF